MHFLVMILPLLLNYKTINRPRARLLLQASLDAGCKIALLRERMRASNPSNQDQQKILHDLKVIATSSTCLTGVS